MRALSVIVSELTFAAGAWPPIDGQRPPKTAGRSARVATPRAALPPLLDLAAIEAFREAMALTMRAYPEGAGEAEVQFAAHVGQRSRRDASAAAGEGDHAKRAAHFNQRGADLAMC